MTKPTPSGPSTSGGRKPTSGSAGTSRVLGSIEVNVQVTRPVVRLMPAVTSTNTPRVARGVDAGAVVVPAGRDADRGVAEAEIAELERAPIQVRIELLGDDDELGRGGGRGLVFKIDEVGERLGWCQKAVGPEAARSGNEVGVFRIRPGDLYRVTAA